MALTWDFTREIGTGSPGNTTSYFTTEAQVFFLKDTEIYTLIGQVDNGHWQDTVYESEQQISDDGYSVLDIEHHFTGTLFGAAYHDGDVVFLVYEYAMDATSLLNMGRLQLQPNNAVKALTAELSQVARARLKDSNYSLLTPGTIVRTKLSITDQPEPTVIERLGISALILDDIRDTLTIKAKNKPALYLLEQTFDDDIEYTGTVKEIIEAILTDAGITAYTVEDNTTETSVAFLPDQSILDGLSEFCSLHNWFVDADREDTILVGSDLFIQGLMPITIHELIREDDLFSRYVDQSYQYVYSRVCVRRSGAQPLKVFGVVPTMDWHVPAKKTFYKDVHDDMSQVEMEALRDSLIENLQYLGIEETFTTAIRPYMQIGDGLIVTDPDTLKVTAGIIVDLQHCFGNEIEPFTQLTLRTGGTMANTPATLTSKYVSRLGHMDRTQKLYDFLSSPDRR